MATDEETQSFLKKKNSVPEFLEKLRALQDEYGLCITGDDMGGVNLSTTEGHNMGFWMDDTTSEFH